MKKIVMIMSWVIVAAGFATADVIFNDSFTRSGDLNGSQPDVENPLNKTWSVGPAATYPAAVNNGRVEITEGTTTVTGSFGYTPTNGAVYKLSADLMILDDGAVSVNQGVGIGFHNVASVTRAYKDSLFSAGIQEQGLFNYRVNGVLTSIGSAGSYAVLDKSYTVEMILDTTETAWTYDISWLDGASVVANTSGVFASNPDLQRVLLGRHNQNADVTIDNFVLQTIPEPTTLSLLGLTAAVLLMIRRVRI